MFQRRESSGRNVSPFETSSLRKVEIKNVLWNKDVRLLILQNFEAYHLEFSSLIRQLVGLGDLFCQLNGPEQGSFVTRI